MIHNKTSSAIVQSTVCHEPPIASALDHDPRWAEVRDFLAAGRRGAEAVVQAGDRLLQLHTAWFRHGSGRRSDLQPLPQVAAKVVTGWQAKVKEELGISDDTARRIIERARYITMMRLFAQGKTVTYCDSKGRTVEVSPTDKMVALAKESLPEIELGAMSPQKAWVGLLGEGTREAMGRQRERTNHYTVLHRALKSLSESLPKWKRLKPEERAELEQLWGVIREALPETWA
ncbi:MAG TPA: hypothetical protein PLU30_27200 [Verrucomicrobiae bacterium]|nr:hypothetical protein [Verrucomicrobiae bacterium]